MFVQRVVAIALVFYFAVHGWASAQDHQGVRFVFQAAPESGTCANVEAVSDAIGAQLGYDPFSEDGDVALQIRVDGRPGRWLVRISLEQTRLGQSTVIGERILEVRSRSCESFLRDIALAASIAVEANVPAPRATSSEPVAVAPPLDDIPEEHDSSVEATPTSIAVAPSTHATVVQSPTDSTPNVETSDPSVLFGVRLGALGSWGLTPEITGGPWLATVVRWGFFSAELEGQFHAPHAIQRGSGSLEPLAAIGVFRACGSFAFVSACASVAAGALHVIGHGYMNDTVITAPMSSLGGSLSGHLVLVPSLAVLIRFEVHASLARTDFLVDGRSAWRTEPLWMALSLGFEWTP
jgi:hypothetical protein